MNLGSTLVLVLPVVFGLLFIIAGIRIVRPVENGIVERFGKYHKTAKQGLHWIIPVVDRMIYVNITEQMVDIPPQNVITKDKLNAQVDAIIYYKVKDVLASLYNIDDHQEQLAALARTTLRAVIGKMSLADANEKRAEINVKVETVLDKETKSYGVEVLRTELQRIDPPEDVQDAMNLVVKAEQHKIAAKDEALAVETKADGERMAAIKKAEGFRQSSILRAEGEAKAVVLKADAESQAIKQVSVSADKYFKGNAQKLKSLETVAKTFKKGTKLILDSKSNVSTIVTDVANANIVPIEKKKPSKS